jgi:hypothetical protein
MKSFRLFIVIALICFALSPAAQAVVPAPDGGYPGANTAEGQAALFSLTTGTTNVAVGWGSLYSDAEGSLNTAAGAGALLFNNSGNNNVAVGGAAGFYNVDGSENTFVGTGVGKNIVSGFNNTYLGNFVGDGVGDESSTIRINDLSGGNAEECFIGGIFNNFQPIPAHGGSGSVRVVTIDLADDHLGWDLLVSADKPGYQAPMQAPQRSAPARRSAPTRPTLGKVEKLEATVAQQQKQIETLTAQLKEQAKTFTAQLMEQAAQIQKVSAQLEVSKPAPQTVLNNQ